MNKFRFNKELYSKTALIKAAYNFTDSAFIHLDADKKYYYVSIEIKKGKEGISEESFLNEMIAQSIRHEIYLQTKNIRELLLARSMASSLVLKNDIEVEDIEDRFTEDEILKDWFEVNDTDKVE